MKNNKVNQATQKKHKLNIVDVAVFVVFLAVVTVAFLVLWPVAKVNEESPMQDKTILYVVELREIDKQLSNSVMVDDNAVLMTESISIGKVVKVNRFSSAKWEIPESGDEMVLSTNPNKHTMVVTIEINCSYQEGVGYFLHGQQLLVGHSINLKFPMFNAVGECISIEVKE